MAEEGQQRHTAQSVRQDGRQKMQRGGFGLLGHGKVRRHQRGAIPVPVLPRSQTARSDRTGGLPPRGGGPDVVGPVVEQYRGERAARTSSVISGTFEPFALRRTAKGKAGPRSGATITAVKRPACTAAALAMGGFDRLWTNTGTARRDVEW